MIADASTRDAITTWTRANAAARLDYRLHPITAFTTCTIKNPCERCRAAGKRRKRPTRD